VAVKLDGRATRARVERIDARARTVVWRWCSRVAFIGRGTTGGGRSRSNRRRLGGASMAQPFRVGRKWGGDAGSRGRGTAVPIRFAVGEEGSSGWRESVGGGGGGGARSDFRRKKVVGRCPTKVTTPGSLTGWAHLSARGRQRSNRTSGAGDNRIGQAEQAGLTDGVGPLVSEGEATGRLGQTGREEMGRGWAGKEERRPGRNYFLG
jgi:hypothetical protein